MSTPIQVTVTQQRIAVKNTPYAIGITDTVNNITVSKNTTQVAVTRTPTTIKIADSGIIIPVNTDQVAEGTANKYYTDSRARAALSATGSLSYNNTTGVVSYTTPATIASLSNHTTTALAEGTNKYYTDARVGTYLTANNYATTTDVSTSIAALVASAPATLDTLNELATALGNDANFAATTANQLSLKLNTADFATTANTWLGTKTTTNLLEGNNQYFTDARAQTAIANSTQTLTNKTFVDASTYFQDETTASKRFQFDAASISALTTRTLTIPDRDGVIITNNDTGTVSNTMLAGSIANNKLANTTISGVALGSNLAVLNIGTGLTGTNATYNGSATTTISNAGVTGITGGTGVAASAATGSVTVSIGQSVATSATPTFASLTLSGGTLSTSAATADLFVSGATTVNIGLASTLTTIGSNTGGTVIIRPALQTNNVVNVKGIHLFDAVTLTTSTTTANQVLDAFTSSVYHCGKYVITAVSGSEYHAVEVLLLTDGTTSLITTYGTLYTGANPLITLTSDMSAGLPRLLVTPANAVTTIRAQKTLVR